MSKIDADAHVIETTRTWDFMRDDEQEFRPQIFKRDATDRAPLRPNQLNEYWKVGNHFQTKTNVASDIPEDVRDMVDIKRRLDHMDEVGIDIQVLFPTLFLRPVTKEHDVELALVRSYNRWLVEIWKQSNDRLRWVALPPLLSMVEPSILREELEFCKASGACGIFMRGLECERIATDRYFYPLFEIAQELDLALCFHAGNNNFANHDSYARNTGMMIFKFPVMGAFLSILTEELPKRFPTLRWAFIEASAQWVPYMVNEARHRLREKGTRAAETVLNESNFYITTQRSDDLHWLLSELGDENLVIGTDYGHKDTAVEIEALKRLADDSDIAATAVGRILETNPSKLYGLA
jgi:predicted TIM-barrel fold metal-dependent hydrolase